MSSAILQSALAQCEALKRDLNAVGAAFNAEKTAAQLNELKIALTKLSFLVPGVVTEANVKELLLAREVLELGAQWSIRTGDIPAFARYLAQLQTYYTDYKKQLPESPRMYPLLGLNLLRLLAQSRIAEFHTALELIDPEQLQNNIYIRHPVQLEQSLMEGRYNHVWHARADVPAEEYKYFIDILMGTIRNEIASCTEVAYEQLPLNGAAQLLYFKDQKELATFTNERGWNVNPKDLKIHFKEDAAKVDAVNNKSSDKTIQQLLNYARELERIV